MALTADLVEDSPSRLTAARAGPARPWPGVLPWLVIAAGVAFSAWLLGLVRPGVFYSGDGGLKLLVVEQFARGELHADLRIPAEPWVSWLWRTGFFPFDVRFGVVDARPSGSAAR